MATLVYCVHIRYVSQNIFKIFPEIGINFNVFCRFYYYYGTVISIYSH